MFFGKKKRLIKNDSDDTQDNVFVCLPSKTLLVGNLKTDRSIRLECDFKGDIVTAGRVVVASEARIEGNIKCASAFISGQVRGNIFALESLTLKKPAHIKGNILTREIYIEPGVIVDGVYKIMEDKKEETESS